MTVAPTKLPVKFDPFIRVLSTAQHDLLKLAAMPEMRVYPPDHFHFTFWVGDGHGNGKPTMQNKTFDSLWRMGAFQRSDSFVPYYTLSERGRRMLKVMDIAVKYDLTINEIIVLSQGTNDGSISFVHNERAGKAGVYHIGKASVLFITTARPQDYTEWKSKGLIVAYHHADGEERCALTAKGEEVQAVWRDMTRE